LNSQEISGGRHGDFTASRQKYQAGLIILECGPMPNVIAALPNIGAPSVQRHKVWLTPTTTGWSKKRTPD